jgi:hypothetical protein
MSSIRLVLCLLCCCQVIKAWSVDPQVLVDGKKGSFFDALEDMDTPACIAKCVAIAKENAAPKNTAYVFIKPHAVTDSVKALVTEQLKARGLTILTEGSLASEVIDEKKLIDQHYYAIASKVSVLCKRCVRAAPPRAY